LRRLRRRGDGREGLISQAGVAEVWIFGLNGLNAEYLAILRETLPLEATGDR